jgi:hypothetical protein
VGEVAAPGPWKRPHAAGVSLSPLRREGYDFDPGAVESNQNARHASLRRSARGRRPTTESINAMSAINKGSLANPVVTNREKGVKIFTYPKIIFMFPTLIMSMVCWIGMLMTGDEVYAPSAKAVTTVESGAITKTDAKGQAKTISVVDKSDARQNAAISKQERQERDFLDFKSPQNVLALLFLGVFLMNLMVLAIDFPRFTVVAGLLLITTVLFLMLWLATYFDLFTPLRVLMSGIYVAANAQFYFFFTLALICIYATIFVVRWLDYWEILPNEILHHHGPWSDLERFPTMNLKFDKEVPDIFEHFMFGSGRLVLYVPSENKAIILDNVLRITQKEEMLKKLMSRMNVRVTTDQEVGG